MSALTPNYHAYVMAVERVEQRLRKVTAALDAAGVRYAVIGGHAVAAWVSRVDPAATRSTKDVDLLVEQRDLDRIAQVMTALGFKREDLRRLVMFTDPQDPSRRTGVHLVWSGSLVRPSYVCPAPTIDEAVRDPQGFLVLDLPALVRMKLTAFRPIDQAHIEDLCRMELIDSAVRESLPGELRERLDQVKATMEPEE